MFWQSERRKSSSFFRILSKMYGIWFLSSLPHPCPLPPLYFKMYCIGFFFFSPTPLSSTSSLFYFRIFVWFFFFSSHLVLYLLSFFQDVRHWVLSSLPHRCPLPPLYFKMYGIGFPHPCAYLTLYYYSKFAAISFHTVVLYLLSISRCTALVFHILVLTSLSIIIQNLRQSLPHCCPYLLSISICTALVYTQCHSVL